MIKEFILASIVSLSLTPTTQAQTKIGVVSMSLTCVDIPTMRKRHAKAQAVLLFDGIDIGGGHVTVKVTKNKQVVITLRTPSQPDFECTAFTIDNPTLGRTPTKEDLGKPL